MDNQSVTTNQIMHCSLAVSEYSSSKLPCCYVTSDKSAPHKRSYSRTGCVPVLNLNMNGITSTILLNSVNLSISPRGSHYWCWFLQFEILLKLKTLSLHHYHKYFQYVTSVHSRNCWPFEKVFRAMTLQWCLRSVQIRLARKPWSYAD